MPPKKLSARGSKKGSARTSQPSSREGEREEPGKVANFKVELALRFTDDYTKSHMDAAQSTSFRIYSSIIEDKVVTTPQLGDEGSWVSIYSDEDQQDDKKADKNQGGKAKKQGKKNEGTSVGDEDSDKGTKDKLQNGVKFHSVTSQQKITKSWAERFATDPEMYVIMDLPVTKDEDDHDIDDGSEPARNRYAAVFTLDLSPLLSNRSSIGVCFGENWPSIEPTEDIASYVHKIENGEFEIDSLKGDLSEEQVEEITKVTRMRKARENFVADPADRPICNLPSCLSSLQFRVFALAEDGKIEPIVSENLREQLNPLTVRLRDVKNLPGISVSGCDESILRYTQPTKGSALEKHCDPIYASFEFDKLSVHNKSVHASFRRTAFSPHCYTPNGRLFVPEEKCEGWREGKYKLDFCTTYLVGLLDDKEACEILDDKGINLRVHDRDAGDVMIKKKVLETDAWCIPWDIVLQHLHWVKSEYCLKELIKLLFGERIGAETTADTSQRWNSYLEGDHQTIESCFECLKDEVPETLKSQNDTVFKMDWLIIREITLRRIIARILNPHIKLQCTFSRLCSRMDERLEILRQRNRLLTESNEQEEQAKQMTKEEKKRERLKRQAERAGANLQDETDETKEETDSVSKTGNSFKQTQQLFMPQDGISTSIQQYSVGVRRECDQPGGENTSQLNDIEKLTRNTPSCCFEETTVRVNLNIFHPVTAAKFHERDIKWKFQRIVLCVRYSNYGPLKTVIQEVDDINKSAVANVKSTYSHELTSEEVDQANKGELDIITGFHVMDDRWRLIVLEGRGSGIGPRKFNDGLRTGNDEKDESQHSKCAMDRLREALARENPNTSSAKMLDDPTVYFSERLYAPFNLFLKTIRLRERLANLVMSSTTYKHDNARYEAARQALQKMFELRRVPRLRHAKMLDTFPMSNQLISVEELYGDSVSLEDLRGPDSEAELARKQEIWRERKRMGVETTVPVPKGIQVEEDEEEKEQDHKEQQGLSTRRAKMKRKGSVQMFNEEYERMKKEHEEALKLKNYIEENIETVDLKSKMNTEQLKEQGKSYQQRRALPEEVEELMKSSHGIHIYSGQKLCTAELHRRILQRKAAEDTQALYTYDIERLSATIAPVDLHDYQRQEKEQELKSRKMPGGFTWVSAKDKKKRYEHPEALTESRREEIREKFQDEEEKKAIEAAKERAIEAGYPWNPVPSKSLGTVFGYVDADGKPDPNFFTTVHMGGEGIEAERQAAQEAELKEWREKVVVDDIVFRTIHQSGKANQIDKYKGMLKSEPKKRTLKQTYRTRRPDGTRGGPEPAPVSMFLESE